MPSQARKRRPPAVAAPSSPDEDKKKRAAPILRASARASKTEEKAEATPLVQLSKKQKRSSIGVGVVGVGVVGDAPPPPVDESNGPPGVKDPYDFDEEEEAASLSPAGAAGSPRFLSGLLQSARKMNGKVKLKKYCFLSPRPRPLCRFSPFAHPVLLSFLLTTTSK